MFLLVKIIGCVDEFFNVQCVFHKNMYNSKMIILCYNVNMCLIIIIIIIIAVIVVAFRRTRIARSVLCSCRSFQPIPNVLLFPQEFACF